MKIVMTILGFLVKIALICLYLCTRGLELLLEAFNNAFKKIIDQTKN